MKIVYIVPHDVTKVDGVTKKVAMQLDQWRVQGHDVKCICIVPAVGSSIVACEQYVAGNFLSRRLFVDKDICESIDAFSPNLIYIRFEGWSATYERLANKYCVAVEINTNVSAELQLNFLERKSGKAFLAYVHHLLFDRRLFKLVDGFVVMTHEMAKSYAGYNVAVIPNGIVLQDHPVIKEAVAGDVRLQCFFMGTGGYLWHGIDIIEFIASKCRSIDFHIVGQSGQGKENVFYHGYMQESDYLKIMSNSHVCIGTLALYRKAMNEACPLKLREYLARGFPVVVGYVDTAFFEDLPEFIFYLDGSDLESIDVRGFQSYVQNSASRIVRHDEIKSIDAGLLESQRLAFFMEIISGKV